MRRGICFYCNLNILCLVDITGITGGLSFSEGKEGGVDGMGLEERLREEEKGETMIFDVIYETKSKSCAKNYFV